MTNFEYLAYPPIPDFLFQSILDKVKPGEMLECFHVPSPVRDFVEPLFPNHYKILVQAIYRDLPIHCDNSRIAAYNFLIETGGDQVYTNFFDKPPIYNLTERHIIEKHKWHYINTETQHNVTGINREKMRISITVYEELKLFKPIIIHEPYLSIDGHPIVTYPALN
jgi:hypothetical protein